MATQSQAANGWSSVTRSGDSGVAWSGGGTALGVADGTYIEAPAYTNGGATNTPAKCPILRVTFPAFSFPVTDVIASATLTVRAQRNSDIPVGVTVQEEGSATTLTGSWQTLAVTLSPSSLTISSLNAGTTTVDVLIQALGSAYSSLLVPPIDNPVGRVDYVALSVTTATPGGDSVFSIGSLTRIPSVGVN